MAHAQRSEMSAALSKVFATLVCAVALLLPATDVSAQGRARLSSDLQNRIQAGSTEETCVIVPGTNAQVDAIAARHGLRIQKRLKSGAVLQVPAGGDRKSVV